MNETCVLISNEHHGNNLDEIRSNTMLVLTRIDNGMFVRIVAQIVYEVDQRKIGQPSESKSTHSTQIHTSDILFEANQIW